MMYALTRHLYSLFCYLLENGYEYSGRARNGSSLLHFVARDADIDTLRFLQARGLEGIDVSNEDQSGLTAFQYAERRRDGIYAWTELVISQTLPDLDLEAWFQAYLALHQQLVDALHWASGTERRIEEE